VTRRLVIPLIAVVAMLAGGCVEDDEPVEAGTDAPTEQAAPAPTPTPEELLAALPEADVLPAGTDWERQDSVVPTEDEESDDDGPRTLCDPEGREHPLALLVAGEETPDGAAVGFQDPDESVELGVLLAPLDGAADLVASAQADIADCAGVDGAELQGLDGWPTVGEASVAFGWEATAPFGPEGGGGGLFTATNTVTFVLAHVGDVVIFVRLHAVTPVTPEASDRLLADEDVQALALDAADRVAALR